MKLYKINDSYPDINFNFAVTPDSIGSLPVEHTHPWSEFGNAREVAAKADINHEHSEYVHNLKVGAQYVSGTVDFVESSTVIPLNDGGSVLLNNSAADLSNGKICGVANANADSATTSMDVLIGGISDICKKNQSIMFLEGV